MLPRRIRDESISAIPVAGNVFLCDRSVHFFGPGSRARHLQSAAHWDKVTGVSKTTATLQVVVNPPLRRGSPIHDNAFKSLHDIQADYVRYVPWLPYPKLGIAELEPPANGKTSWDFSLIDPMTIDFLEATKGHSVILNFSTIPAVDVQDRQACDLSGRSRSAGVGLHPGHRVPRS